MNSLECERQLREVVEKAKEHERAETHPAVTAYVIAQEYELSNPGKVANLIHYAAIDERPIPSEFTAYIENEDGDLGMSHLRAIARRSLERYIYEELNGD